MAYENELTGRHIKKVAELLDGNLYYRLGTELGIPYQELENFTTPLTGGPAQYAARVLNKWRKEHAHLSATRVRSELFKAVKASGRSDIATDVLIGIQTESDIEKVFQDISGKLVKDWRTVGIHLGIPDDDLQAAKAYPDLQEEPALKMLQRWQKRTLTRQRSQLIAALTELKLQNIVKAIEDIDQEFLRTQSSAGGYRSQAGTSGGAQTWQSSQLYKPPPRVSSLPGQQYQTSGRFSALRETSLTPDVPVQAHPREAWQVPTTEYNQRSRQPAKSLSQTYQPLVELETSTATDNGWMNWVTTKPIQSEEVIKGAAMNLDRIDFSSNFNQMSLNQSQGGGQVWEYRKHATTRQQHRPQQQKRFSEETTRMTQPSFISRHHEESPSHFNHSYDSYPRAAGAASPPWTDFQTQSTAPMEEGSVDKKFESVLKRYKLDWFIDHDCIPKGLKETIEDPEVTVSQEYVKRRLCEEKKRVEDCIQQMQLTDIRRVQSANTPLRCVLLGKTGSGKSSLGNLLVGRKVFRVGELAKSETHRIQYCHTDSVEVIDTPGLGDSNENVDAEFEIGKIFETFKEGIHCFLYVFNMGNKRADKGDVEIFRKIKDMFGERMKTHTILVLTHPDENLVHGDGLKKYVSSIRETNLREIFNIIGNRIIAMDNRASGYKLELHREGVINMIKQNVSHTECYTPSFFKEAKNALEESKRKRREKIEAQEKETDRIVLDRLKKSVSTASVNRLLDLTYNKDRKASLIETIIGSVPTGKEYARKEGMKMLTGLVENQLQQSFIELVSAYVVNCNFSVDQYIATIERDNSRLVHAIGRQHVANMVGMRYRELWEKKMTEDRLAKLQLMEAAAAQAVRDRLEGEARLLGFMEAQVKMYVKQNIAFHGNLSYIVDRVLEGNPTFDRQKTQDLVQRFLWSDEGRALVNEQIQSERDKLRRSAISKMEELVRIGTKTFISNKTRKQMQECKTNPTIHMKTTDEIILQIKRGLSQEHCDFLSEEDIRASVVDSLNESINNVNNAGFLKKCKMAFSFLWGKKYTEKLMDPYAVGKLTDLEALSF